MLVIRFVSLICCWLSGSFGCCAIGSLVDVVVVLLAAWFILLL
jgi:hypothetical protein